MCSCGCVQHMMPWLQLEGIELCCCQGTTWIDCSKPSCYPQNAYMHSHSVLPGAILTSHCISLLCTSATLLTTAETTMLAGRTHLHRRTTCAHLDRPASVTSCSGNSWVPAPLGLNTSAGPFTSSSCHPCLPSCPAHLPPPLHLLLCCLPLLHCLLEGLHCHWAGQYWAPPVLYCCLRYYLW
jgi:hypothetical protein